MWVQKKLCISLLTKIYSRLQKETIGQYAQKRTIAEPEVRTILLIPQERNTNWKQKNVKRVIEFMKLFVKQGRTMRETINIFNLRFCVPSDFTLEILTFPWFHARICNLFGNHQSIDIELNPTLWNDAIGSWINPGWSWSGRRGWQWRRHGVGINAATTSLDDPQLSIF